LAGRQREFEAGMAGGLRRAALEEFLADTREVAEVLERNLQRAAEQISSFKQIAVDQSSYQRRVFKLAELVQEIGLALSPVLRRAEVQLIDTTPEGLRMDSYPGPLGQVLINLLNNAVVHAFEGRPGGVVRIAAERDEPGCLRLRLSDNGRGVAAEHLGRIFDPFFTTRLGSGGSGLGLHIVYTLVTGLLGGRIEVRSVVGAGTEFQIELPLVAPMPQS
jgi:signal transduction histidine kinase